MKRPDHPRVYFFGSADPAASQTPNADDGAITILRGIDRRPLEVAAEEVATEDSIELDYVYARKIRSADVAQWSGLIHGLHRRFGFASLLVDAGGGGAFIQAELKKHEQLIDGVRQAVIPLITRDEDSVLDGLAILTMLRLRDSGIQAVWPALPGDDVLKAYCHMEMKKAVDAGRIGRPKPTAMWTRDEVEGWTEEERLTTSILDEGCEQLTKISVVTDAQGKQVFTVRGVRKFQSLGHDDVAMSMIYAYIAFMIWLRKGGAQAGAGDANDDWRGFRSS